MNVLQVKWSSIIMNQDLNYTYPAEGGDGFVIEKKKNVDSGNNRRVSGFNFR